MALPRFIKVPCGTLMHFVPCRFVSSDKKQTEFYATLRSRVDAYFKDKGISKHYNMHMIIKTVILLLIYVGSFVTVLFVPLSPVWQMAVWGIMGMGMAGIGMSVMHDANHGAYSSSHKVNEWLGYTLNLLGGSVFNWKLQHNILHHTYTNIASADDDVEDKLVLRFNPHTQVKWYHKFQVVYAFLFYGILTLYWVVAKDFVQFRKYTRQKVNKNTPEQNRTALFKIIISKVVYLLFFAVLPIVVLHKPVLLYAVGYLFMHFVAGVVLTVIFQLAHTVENTTHPLPDGSNTIDNNWAVHQMETTINFSPTNKLISWYVGGLNYQVEHHLFPTICHVHYPHIAPIVKRTAEEYGVPYMVNETFGKALASHVRTLIRFGKLPDLNEAIG